MKKNLRKLVTASVIGALYAALTFALAPISYSPLPILPLELRISEVLCILPFFFPESAIGLFVGCLIANILSPYGPLDVVFGSLATLLSGLCTAAIGIRARRKSMAGWSDCVYACLMPVLFNAPIVGAVIAYTSTQYAFLTGFAIYGLQVGLGEAVVMLALGLPAMRYISKSSSLSELFARLQ